MPKEYLIVGIQLGFKGALGTGTNNVPIIRQHPFMILQIIIKYTKYVVITEYYFIIHYNTLRYSY